MWNLDYILVYYGMSLSLIINYIVNTDELIRILRKTPLPLSLGSVEDPIISCIGVNGDIFIFFNYIHGLTCLFSISKERLEFPIII